MHTSIPRLDQPGFAHWKFTGLKEFNLKVRLRLGWGRILEESLYWNKFELITRRPQEVSFHFEIFHYLPSFFLLRPLLILDEFEHELSKPKQKAEANNTDTRFDNSQQNAKTEFTNCFIINFLNNLKKKTLLFEFANIRELDRTWLMQYGLSC